MTISLTFALAVIFVIGLIMLAVGSNSSASWCVKAGTIVMAICGVLWLIVGRGG